MLKNMCLAFFLVRFIRYIRFISNALDPNLLDPDTYTTPGNNLQVKSESDISAGIRSQNWSLSDLRFFVLLIQKFRFRNWQKFIDYPKVSLSVNYQKTILSCEKLQNFPKP